MISCKSMTCTIYKTISSFSQINSSDCCCSECKCYSIISGSMCNSSLAVKLISATSSALAFVTVVAESPDPRVAVIVTFPLTVGSVISISNSANSIASLTLQINCYSNTNFAIFRRLNVFLRQEC